MKIKIIITLFLVGLFITIIWSLFLLYTERNVPKLSIGDQWTFLEVHNYGKVYTKEIIDSIEDVEGVPCYVRTQNSSYVDPAYWAHTVWITSDWEVLKTSTQQDVDLNYFTIFFPGWKLYDFPLTVGKEWGGKSHCTIKFLDSEGEISDTGYSHNDWVRNVVSTETITVPAGTFETYVVEEVMMGKRKRFWFSVDVKNYVKMEIDDVYLVTKVLLSYELAPRENEYGALFLFIALASAIGVLSLTFFFYSRRQEIAEDF